MYIYMSVMSVFLLIVCKSSSFLLSNDDSSSTFSLPTRSRLLCQKNFLEKSLYDRKMSEKSYEFVTFFCWLKTGNIFMQSRGPD